MYINELAPDMSHAGHFVHMAGAVELVEPGTSVRMYPALVGFEVFGGLLGLAVP